MLELGYQKQGEENLVEVGYRIYISGDTLMGEYISALDAVDTISIGVD